MSATPAGRLPRPGFGPILVVSSVALLAVSVASGTAVRTSAVMVVVVALAAAVRPTFIAWRHLLALLILVILFIPMRRYALPGNLPFQLEPYRLYVALLLCAWLLSSLVDARTRIRRIGLEGPLAVVVGAAVVSMVANSGRVGLFSSEVTKDLTFLVSFVLLLYLVTSVVRSIADVDHVLKTLVLGGAVVAFFAIVEARSGVNVFNHLSRVIPYLSGGEIGGPEFQRLGTARLRVFGSAEHPIALSAAMAMLTPLGVALWQRTRERRWALGSVVLAAGCMATISRTGVVMLATVALVYLVVRPRETARLWPFVPVALVAVHLLLPGTLGAIKHTFFPPGGLVAEQRSAAGEVGSGRLADLGPALREWERRPLFGQGYGTRVVDPRPGLPAADILDDQWLGTLLETGLVGVLGWLWLLGRVIRRLVAEARRDRSDAQWLVALAAGITAYAVGMVTFDAFSFIQVTFLFFVFVGLGCAILAERSEPGALRDLRVHGGGARLGRRPPTMRTT